MKSLLQEANTIERALDKAWNQAGKPKEFTIKVLDEGERNFLGLTRRPAIVSILYKPEKLTAAPMISRNKEERSGEKHERRERTMQTARNNQEATRRPDNNNDRSRRYAGTEEQRTAFNRAKSTDSWQDEWRDFVLSEIEALLSHMGISVRLSAQTTADKVLTVSLDRAILESDEDQRMLFATLSYLSIQLLKRNYKSRFAGYRVAVTGPKADGSSMSADSEDSLPRNAFEPRAAHNRGQQQAQQPQQGGQKPREAGEQRASGNGERKDKEGRGERGQQRGGDRDRRPRRERAPQEQSQPHEYSAVAGNERNHEDIVADQARFAQQQLSREDKKAVPLKKDLKYQPFFVIEDEDSGK